MKVKTVTGNQILFEQTALKMLEKAYGPGMADETFQMLYTNLLAQHSLLWLAYDGDQVYGAAATQVVVYPNGRRVCVIVACAGHHWADWSHTIKEIEIYAKNMNCAAVRLSGRKGWKRVLKGYKEPWVMLEKDL